MAIDLGRFEDIGFANVIYTGLSREETCRVLKASAKKLGIKLKINYVPNSPVGSVVWDTRTGRVSLEVPYHKPLLNHCEDGEMLSDVGYRWYRRKEKS